MAYSNYQYVIAGGGPSGLFTAWRLLKSGVEPGQVKVLEMSPQRTGGRIFTKTVEKGNGQYVEMGGMRFSTGHKMVQKVICDLGIADKIVPFPETDDRLFYLRKHHVKESDIPDVGVPYFKSVSDGQEERYKVTSDALFDDVSQAIANHQPGSNPKDRTRAQWCEFYEDAIIPALYGSQVFPAGTPVKNIGYWNLLYDYLGTEGFQYIAAANGYASNVINWNSADAIPYNGEFGSDVEYQRLNGGYDVLFDALKAEILSIAPDAIQLNKRLRAFESVNSGEPIPCLIDNIENTAFEEVMAEHLFLAMPRHSVELVSRNCPSSNILNQPEVKLFIESVLEQPSVKIALVYDTAWWLDAPYKPNLGDASSGLNYGPSITDIPLRQVYYFGDDAPNGDGSGPYVLLASYDDERFTRFWEVMEVPLDETRKTALSLDYQPLGLGDPLPSSLQRMIQLQLAELHYGQGTPASVIPEAIESYYMDWGLPPFGAGYHAWAAHYNICEVMQKIRRPSLILPGGSEQNVFIVGSTYSNDQAWVEGAFCTAESVLTDFFGLQPLLPPNVLKDYRLICGCLPKP
jgi:hypothetical protein